MREGVSVRRALELLRKAKLCYVFIKTCPDDGIYLKVSKAQVRRAIDKTVEGSLTKNVNILATLDDRDFFFIN